MPRKPSLSRTLLKLIHDATSPLYVLDASRKIIFVSPALETLLAITAEQIVGLRADYSTAADGILGVAASLALPPQPHAERLKLSLLTTTGQLHPRMATASQLMLPSGIAATLVVVEATDTAIDETLASRAGSGELTSDQLHQLLATLRQSQLGRYHTDKLIGNSVAISRVREQIALAAKSHSRVLVTGSEGTGREHVARTIHLARDWKNIPLPIVDCAVMDAELLQSTLTGIISRHLAREAASGESASKNIPPTALLLGVDKLKSDAQQELASFLLLPGVNLLTLATSRYSLQKLAQKGKFRRDLAFALSTLTIALPPLKSRLEDLPLLAHWFVEQENLSRASQLSGVAPAAIELLAASSWTGNIEELAQVIREGCARATGRELTAADLPDRVHLAAGVLKHPPREVAKIVLDDFLADVEKQLLERALRESRNNKSRAAELLGISRARLLRRLAQLGLAPATAADIAADEPVIFEPLPDSPS
ncbi:PAS modulated sigma54 specific transcriptional regulator, Fis family [Pirellula staleyi DSM 6068]|uniref:PAS modulated sigma54 specific transcriptional regulator, Fis family n=1 Tax=Pirellula staleyi (strain ATCC 27377 / DSM 6068 / ICPB 4128) TaxID=530564 RepID=D2R5F6_PIRSD|nr:sigma-54-dependent Fis family transcriptional regulator [Pirellula staleyi]ADB15415.1 PAS modulated sigma54 specific transcriptional regulator, Fis family [Pirellula staleyi DSM 6068]